ncbi:MAG: OmpA family protein [Flavobacteriia bacterium]|nr:OmpA family protein [Flavobacteriia bacterium]OIP46001.1 MAG: cell envelope biogenesis protein OmpA [Flavobacteriaceae bacterium CG2_30_31_66]PIV95859.1 MAG: cell envelope biogenesis protein OmpA [Flavobacteriaceae bacterium CG17_big_fil_post_rev_8_21_14_2_50_31_13]PIX11018.1 MAG: cell envelope biogenesis protein OmpA [Flavobacteriaceae bacterium CG_4_8_14_3_um_filter_31_8]PIY15344.1 MAG: cell envelope biogenesis protein OmpA [Flavobacteriaceae bacterium CG_4_10_14_3_um_filter_31_253]PIZ111
MKFLKTIFLVGLLVLISNNATGQDYNKWSIDLGAGVHTIGVPLSADYFASPLGQGNFGVRYMLNNKFGLRIDLGFSKFNESKGTTPFSSNYYRATIEGIVNIGNVLNFNSWSKRINLLFHTGGGFSSLNTLEPTVNGGDGMVNLLVGLTPQFKINDKISLFADFSSIIHFGQGNSIDGGPNPTSRETNVSMFNTSLGVNIAIGKKKQHADFTSEEIIDDKIVSELEILKKRLDSAEVQIEKLKNKEFVFTNELIITELDERYVKKGEKISQDGNIIDSNVDFIKELLNRGYENVYFEVNKTTIQEGSLNSINYLRQFMLDNPSVNAAIIGYADETGSENLNKSLSAKRAKKVYDMLVAAGINSGRLSYAGGGVDASVGKEARPLARKVIFRIQ